MARRRKLSPERKEFIDSLIANYNPKDLSDVCHFNKGLNNVNASINCNIRTEYRREHRGTLFGVCIW